MMDAYQAAIYVRTNPERNTTEDRIAQCLQFAQEQGYVVSDEHIYQDIASGLTRDRIGLESLKKAMQEHVFSVLIVDELAQLSRDPKMLALMLFEAKEAGVHVVSVAAPPAGYKWNENHTELEVFPQEAAVIKRLFEEYQA
jgi:DNA invertase Pin-like site-specific DNA recombinase